jgi:hypothetical protein
VGPDRWGAWDGVVFIRGGDGLLVDLDCLGDLGLLVVEPVGRPDPVEAPAEGFQLVLAEPVAVAGGGRSVVAGTVAFDGQHHAAGFGWVAGGEVDAVARRPVLRE